MLHRGTIIPSVKLIMDALQIVYPRRIFPDVGGRREATLDPAGWTPGGTSPAGESLGGPGGSYYIGQLSEERMEGAPHRIVWEPPRPGQERFLPPQRLGPQISQAPLGTPQLTTRPDLPTDWGRGASRAPYGHYAAHQLATREIPMQVYCWGNDYPDTEELVHWLASTVHVVLGGTQGPGGAGLVTLGGWYDRMANRGIVYQLTVNLYAPVFAPPFSEAQFKAVDLLIKQGRFVDQSPPQS